MSVSSESGADRVDAVPALESSVDRVEPEEAAAPAGRLGSPWDSIEFPEGGIWVRFWGEEDAGSVVREPMRLHKVYSVRVPPGSAPAAGSLGASRGSNVLSVSAEPTEFTPEEPVDVVTFHHALTAIPDWFSAIDNAWNFLKPGGMVGVVDYYVSRQRPAPGYARHGWAARAFWPLWFQRRNRFLSPDHLPYLHDLFERWSLREDRVRVPFLLGEGVPRYTFVGRKRDDA